MKGTADQQTYQRGLMACGLGLGIQLLLIVASALVQLWSGSPAVAAATWHLVGGLPIWIVLLLIYQQHRLERAEALEAEQLARSAAAASAIFETAEEDLGLARRRLDNLYKWGLNLVSVLVAVYLLTVGALLLNHTLNLLRHEARTAAARAVDLRDQVGPALSMANLRGIAAHEPGSALVNGLVIFAAAAAIIAFVAARYVSGMTRIREWQLLRGGAGYLMGNAVMLALLLVAAFIAMFADLTFVGVMALVLPAFMMFVGLEILLLMLLGAYRPRRPGELPRPAFESRLLGWLTSPESIAKIINETINYQFGFEVSRSWFYQLLGRAITPLLVVAALVMLGVSCLVIVEPYEQALVTRFGRVTEASPLGPGAHLKLPWPVDKATRYAVDRVQEIVVGSVAAAHHHDEAILWTNEHAGGAEHYLITGASAPARTGVTDEPAPEPATPGAAAASRGMALIAAEAIVRYQIIDLNAYVRRVDEPRRLLRALAERRVNELLVASNIDHLLGDGRIAAADELRRRLQADADDAGLGVTMVMASLVGIHPPQAQGVAEAFQEQIAALQEKESLIEEAQRSATASLATVAGSVEQAQALAEAIRQLEQADDADPPQRLAMQAAIDQMLAHARGQAAQRVHSALGYRWERELTERGKAQRFLAQVQAFRRAPDYYRAREYLDALTQVLPQTRRFVVPDAAQAPGTIRLDLTEAASGLSTLLDSQ